MVWHHTVTVAQMMPFLPHVDFVLILGIEKPGCCGQTVMGEALQTAELFASMAGRYGYQLIFDGGVTTTTWKPSPLPSWCRPPTSSRPRTPSWLPSA